MLRSRRDFLRAGAASIAAVAVGVLGHLLVPQLLVWLLVVAMSNSWSFCYKKEGGKSLI